MLSDSSLTNILVVSGVSQIRYRVYSQHCDRSQLVDYLKNKPEKHDLVILKAYRDLVMMSIPVLWQPTTDGLELWVFWFDERHTGKIDANDDLYALEEIRVGSFTWENAYSKIQSPTASPGASSAQSNTSVPVTVSEEYKLFIRSIRNLIQLQMKRKGAFPLGEFYVFPDSDKDVIVDTNPTSLLKATSSMLCCSYTIYLASTNLIFQPNTRRIQIRPMTAQTLRTRGRKVILSPSGETVWIGSHHGIPQQTEETVLRQWSNLFDIPYEHLCLPDLPNVIALKRSTNEDPFYYPTALVFLPSSNKMSPTAMAGMHGLSGFNQGFSEDLGDRWHRWTWSEQISNFWEYKCPRDTATTVVLDTLSQENGPSTTGASLLQKAMSEPVISSPLMATKSVATPGSAVHMNPISTPSSGQEEDVSMYSYRNNKSTQPLSLAEFAMTHFGLPTQENDMIEYSVIQTPILQYTEQPSLPPPPQQPPPPPLPQQEEQEEQDTNQLALDSFGMVENMDVDNMVLDTNRWTDDGMNDLDNFDFGVTEEDFNFFETTNTQMMDTNMLEANTLILPTDNLVKHEMDLMSEFEDKVMPVLEEPPKEIPPIEQQSDIYVPSQFAPVKFDFMVNDAKYAQGGKFTYTPHTNELVLKTRKPSEEYRPDYIPILRTRKKGGRRKSSKLLLDTIDKENKSLENTHATIVPTMENEDKTHTMDNDNSNNNNNSTTTTASSSSSSSSSSNSDDSSSSSDDDDHSVYSDSTSVDMESEDDASKANRVLNALNHAQDKYIQQCMTVFSSNKTVKLDQVFMDYDSPFARSVASSVIRLDSTVNVYEQAEALNYLCQQAVMGGYPFSGNIEAMSSNGFEANEGESAQIVIARRRNLLQRFHGDAVHIPSTPSDVDFMIQHFKHVLSDIFHQQQQRKHTLDDMCLDQLPIPSSVTVKGPLNVQQYYDLSETNQAHSKYGKYQVKKRRPAEPNLDILQPPNITVSRQEEFLEGTCKLIMFWEKLRLEPYSNKKHITYFVLYPKNDTIETQVAHFFKGLSTLYETCQLGAHHPGNLNQYKRGLVPVPLLPAHEHESVDQRQVRSYMAECQQLGAALSQLNESTHIVIYMVNPASHLSSHLDLSRCFSQLVQIYHTSMMHRTNTSPTRPVLQLMPIEHLLRSTSFGGCLKFGMKEIAFSVYSKCHTVISRQQGDAVTDIYTPPFILSKPAPAQIQFKLKKAISAFPTILESQQVLHLGYTFSFDRRWMVIVWTDSHGELVEFAILDSQQYSSVFEEAWSRTKQVSKRTGFTWTFVIAKMGLLFEDELKSWISCLSEEQVAIVSMDIESTLSVNASTFDPVLHDILPEINTPGMMNTTSSKKMFSDVIENGHTKALLLNHRVAYSNKRERMSLGILHMDPISEIEDWMIPLASGYMIHTPPTTENPNSELFNCSPVILEIHLVYNQTNHSAYSTLGDIIKKYHALSFVNVMPSNNNCFPIHLALVERLCRLLLVVHT